MIEASLVNAADEASVLAISVWYSCFDDRLSVAEIAGTVLANVRGAG